MAVLFGIKNCDTVKKARQWLDKRAITYQFHDVRIDGLGDDQINHWLGKIAWQTLVNKRSTTWNQLSDETREHLDEDNVTQILLANPTLIKRPVLEYDGAIFVGFKPDQYENIFAQS